MIAINSKFFSKEAQDLSKYLLFLSFYVFMLFPFLMGWVAEKIRLCLSGESVNMQQFFKDSPELKIAFVIVICL